MTSHTANSGEGAEPNYTMILFVAGDEPNSRIARANFAALCEQDLQGRCEASVVDVLEDWAAAAQHSILVTPTLLVTRPEPGTRIIGNLNDREKVRRSFHQPVR